MLRIFGKPKNGKTCSVETYQIASNPLQKYLKGRQKGGSVLDEVTTSATQSAVTSSVSTESLPARLVVLQLRQLEREVDEK
jgi:hypothetical protein